MSRGIYYFTYGEVRPEVVEAVIGHPPKKVIQPAGLTGYRAYIQTYADITDPDARQALAEPRNPKELEDFRTAIAVRDQAASVLPGAAIEVTPDDLDALDFYNAAGKWGQWFTRERRLRALMGDPLHSELVTAHVVENPPAGLEPVPKHEGMFPEPFNDPGRTLEIARFAGAAFLAQQAKSGN